MKTPTGLALAYFAIAASWIVLSDRISLPSAAESHPGAGEIVRFQTIKGLAFVTATAILLYLLNAREYRRLEDLNRELVESYDATLRGWVRALDQRNEETKNHTVRVVEQTVRLARKMGYSGEDLENVRRGATLHDIGKIGIPDEILTKPGPLDEDEWKIMRTHPDAAVRLLGDVAFLRPALAIPHRHHEKWDGTGYPDGLKGEAIPEAARIFAAIDVWDALTHDRVYKKAWPREKAVEFMREQAGTHFDPKVIDAFLAALPELDEAETDASRDGLRAGETPDVVAGQA